MEKNNILDLKKAIALENIDAADISPYQMASILEATSRALIYYIGFANERLGSDSEGYMNNDEINNINAIFKELTDNFFPMAHSVSPLRNLQIVDKEEFLRVKNELKHLMDICKSANEISRGLDQSIKNLVNP